MQCIRWNIIRCGKFTRPLIVVFTLLCLFSFSTLVLGAAAKAPEPPEKQITVKDYKWGPGGAGTVGIIKEITLGNKGKIAYKDIRIEVEFYSINGVPLGSLRSAIHDVLPAESEKTFYNVNLGLMSLDPQKTVIRIVGAKTLETVGLPKDLIVVKNWEWTGGRYTTEGVLKEITLENKSGTNYKNIEIQLDYFSGSGTKLGPSRAVIHDVLPAKGEKTFYGINVGFRHPDANKTLVSVVDAARAPVKKSKPGLVKKGIPIGKLKKKVTAKAGKKTTAKTTEKQTQITTSSLSEETGTVKTPQTKVAKGFKKETPQKTEEMASAPPPADIAEPSQEGDLSEKEIGAPSPEEEATIEDLEEGAIEEEESVPRDDIVVKDFKWGSGITGTIGVLRELTLENISGITYTNIHLIVDFYSRSELRPLGSNEFTIYDILPANSEKVFRDVKIGFLNSLPEKIEIKVLSATVMR